MREQEIITLLLEKEQQGIEELLRHYGPLMRYIIAPILPDPQDREECLSEVTMRVWEKIEQYDAQRGSWNSWLTALSRNTALNRVRQNRRSEAAEELSTETPSQDLTPEERILQQERRADLMHALNQLAQKDRMLFYRKYYYRQSTAQIASELGMTERAVEGRLYRLRRKLQKWLGGEHDA